MTYLGIIFLNINTERSILTILINLEKIQKIKIAIFIVLIRLICRFFLFLKNILM